MNIFDLIDPEVEKPQIQPEIAIQIKKRQYHIGRDKYIKNEALRLYLQPVSNSKIAQKLGVNRKTIMAWAQEGGWEVKRKKLEEKTGQNVVDSVKEMKERHIKITKAIQAAVINQIREGKLKLTATDGLKALEHEARLLMPENYSTQINNNISPESFINLLQEAKAEEIAKQK